jgi:hypothetical protein
MYGSISKIPNKNLARQRCAEGIKELIYMAANYFHMSRDSSVSEVNWLTAGRPDFDLSLLLCTPTCTGSHQPLMLWVSGLFLAARNQMQR